MTTLNGVLGGCMGAGRRAVAPAVRNRRGHGTASVFRLRDLDVAATAPLNQAGLGR